MRAAVRDDRDVLAGVEPEPGDHPPDEVDAVARQHPEVVARVVHAPGRAISMCRVDRSGRAVVPPSSSRFVRTVVGRRLVGHDHRVGDLAVGQRDRQPRAAGAVVSPTSAGRSSAVARSDQRPPCQ